MRRLAPVALLATGACFATQNDMRVLQNDLQVLQAEQLAARAAADSVRAAQIRGDSIMRAQLDRVLAAFGALNDSLRAANIRMTRFQGQVRGDLYNLGQQILAVQTLTGQSAERLREFRAQMERSQQAMADEQGATSGRGSGSGGGRSGTPPPPTTPGPEQLYDIGLEQLTRGSHTTARRAFQDLIHQHPTSLNAPDAQLKIGLSYEQEGNQAAADSVFALVVARYPRAVREAANALYKHALSLQRQGKRAEANALIAKLRREYPAAEEAELSRHTFPPPGS